MTKLAILFLSAALVCSAAQNKMKLSSDIRTTQGLVQVLIQWNNPADLDSDHKIAALGGTVLSDFQALHSGVYFIPSSALEALSADSDVKFISADRKVHKRGSSVGITAATVNAQESWKVGYTGQGIGVAVIDSGILKDDNLGSNTHGPVYTEDFTVPGGLTKDGKPASKPASYGLDWFGHGQHIAGIIASNGKSSNCADCSQTFVGIAPNAALVNLKVLDTNGEGTDSSVIAAINRAIQLKDMYNIRVMNLSLGRPVYESYTNDPLCQAVEAAWKAGIAVIVSAGNDGRDDSFGNDGYGTINAPGNDPYVITVGAMRSMGTASRSDDLIASYSSKGPTMVDHIVKPDILAPGNQIVSLLAPHGTLPLSAPQNIPALASYQNKWHKLEVIPTQPDYDPTSSDQPPAVKVGGGYSTQYFILSGTSMATAVVSGAAADLIQANPSLTPDQVKLLLMRTASKTFPTTSVVLDSTTGRSYTSYYDIFTVGAGYMDLASALKLVNDVPSGLTATSPTTQYDEASGCVELMFEPDSLFSQRTLWGSNSMSSTRALWGSGSTWSDVVLSGNRALWGSGAIWGASSDLSAKRALWGSTALWGNRALWGSSTTPKANSTLTNGEQDK